VRVFARLITLGGVWPPHGLCRPCRGCWRLRPAPSRAHGRAASRPSQTVRRTPPNIPAAIRCGRTTCRARSPPPATRVGHHGKRGGDPHPHRVTVRWRCRHLPHAAARRHSLRARSRLQLVVLRTCHTHLQDHLRSGVPFLSTAPPGGRWRASVDREYADPAVTPPAFRRSSLAATVPTSLSLPPLVPAPHPLTVRLNAGEGDGHRTGGRHKCKRLYSERKAGT